MDKWEAAAWPVLFQCDFRTLTKSPSLYRELSLRDIMVSSTVFSLRELEQRKSHMALGSPLTQVRTQRQKFWQWEAAE